MYNMTRAVAGALVAGSISVAALTANAASGVQGIPAGTWYAVQAAYCYQIPGNGYTFLYIYPAAGGFLWTYEPDVVSSLSEFCAYGTTFYVYSSDGSSWTYSYLAPGL